MLDRLVDTLERSLPTHFARQQPMAGNFRLLVTATRVLPELERIRDLVTHIAHRCEETLSQCPPTVIVALCEMGAIAGELWGHARNALRRGLADDVDEIERRDDDLDALCAGLTTVLLAASVSRDIVLNTALLGRFYERLGDHAVHLAGHTMYLVSGATHSRDR